MEELCTLALDIDDIQGVSRLWLAIYGALDGQWTCLFVPNTDIEMGRRGHVVVLAEASSMMTTLTNPRLRLVICV